MNQPPDDISIQILNVIISLIDIVEAQERRLAALEVKPKSGAIAPSGFVRMTDEAALAAATQARKDWWASLELEAEL